MHGDDFVTVGSKNECRWLKTKLSRRFEIKTTIIGGGGDTMTEGGETPVGGDAMDMEQREGRI